jgi:hypothetical protein
MDSDDDSTSVASSQPLSSVRQSLDAECAREPEQAERAEAPSKRRRPRRRPANVWKQAKQEDIAEAERTTLLVKNLDRTWGTMRLVERLDAEGLRGTFDFVYAPIDFNDQLAFGYAFLNFCTPQAAREASERLKAWVVPGPESVDVQWTTHQGLAVQVDRYQNSPVMHESIPRDLKPMLFKNGAPLEFPAPTREIQLPRSRRRGDAVDASARHLESDFKF